MSGSRRGKGCPNGNPLCETSAGSGRTRLRVAPDVVARTAQWRLPDVAAHSISATLAW